MEYPENIVLERPLIREIFLSSPDQKQNRKSRRSAVQRDFGGEAEDPPTQDKFCWELLQGLHLQGDSRIPSWCSHVDRSEANLDSTV